MRHPGPAPSAPGRLAPLDGVRAIAILVVMAYHSGVPGLATGGFYGQDAFFVLSGLLITSLLLEEGRRRRAIDLLAFWGRRIRRLLPALVVLLLAVDVYVTYVAPAGRYPGFAVDARSTLFYVANWHMINASSDYFTATGHPSLLTHTWSLAIEEQFYLVWPLVLLAVLWLLRRRRHLVPPAVLALSGAGALLSAGWMALLYAGGASPSRLYYGSDTHAQCLLVGAALAAGLRIAGRRGPRPGLFPVARGRRLRAVVHAAGLAGAAGACWLWTHVPSASAFAYEGGFLCIAVCTAAVLAAVTCVPDGLLARALGWRPIAFVGLVSYGMYLWYFPAFAVLTSAHTGLRSWPLFAVRAAVVFGLAVASWYVVERPLQRGGLLRMGAGSWPRRTRPVVLTAAAVVAILAVVQAPSGAALAAPRSPAPMSVNAASTGVPPQQVLLVGDSLAYSLQFSLGDPTIEDEYGYRLTDGGIRGCGLTISTVVNAHGSPAVTPAACNPRAPAAQQWPALMRAEVEQLHPDVVIVAAGRWEMFDRKASTGGSWQDITQPEDAAYVRGQLERSVAIGGSSGARVDLATAPCFSSGEQPDGRPWPSDSPERLTAYNDLVAQVAAAHPGQVSVLPLGALVCPDGRFHTDLDGLTVRAPDGVHYPFFDPDHPQSADPGTAAQAVAFGAWLAQRIMPVVLTGRQGPVGR